MSWDLSVVGFRNTPPPMADMDGTVREQPLGDRVQVQNFLNCIADQIVWHGLDMGILTGDGFSIEFILGNNDPVSSFVMHVRGDVSAMNVLQSIAAQPGWYVVDSSSSEWWHHMDDPSVGLARFNAFSAKVRQSYAMDEQAAD